MAFLKKFLTVLLLAVILVTTVSCGRGEESDTSVNSVDDNFVDFYGYKIPKGLNYNDAEITILTTETASSHNSYQIVPYSNPAYDETAAAARVVASANVARAVEEALGVKLNEEIIFTWNRYGGEMYLQLQRDAIAGTCDYLFATPCIIEGAMLAREDMLYDLANIVDLKEEWWCQPFNDSLAVSGKYYMATGDLGTISRDATLFVAFNKKMAESYHITESYGYSDLYEMVDDKAWTQDVMFEMAKSVYHDNNQNHICDPGDINGVSGQIGMVFWLLRSGGESICALDGDGIPYLSVGSERSVALIEQAQRYLQDPAVGFICADDYFNLSSVPVSDVIVPEFKADRCLFFMNAILNLELIRDMESDFGVIPCPLYDSTQDNYNSNVGAWSCNAICIPTAVDEADLEMAGHIISALSAASREILTPVYYEQTLQYQITRDEDSMRMLDIIFENRTPDLCEVFQFGKMKDVVNNMITAKVGTFVSSFEAAKDATIADIEETVEAFESNIN